MLYKSMISIGLYVYCCWICTYGGFGNLSWYVPLTDIENPLYVYTLYVIILYCYMKLR